MYDSANKYGLFGEIEEIFGAIGDTMDAVARYLGVAKMHVRGDEHYEKIMNEIVEREKPQRLKEEIGKMKKLIREYEEELKDLEGKKYVPEKGWVTKEMEG